MSEATAKRVLLLTFLAALVTITYYDLKSAGKVVKAPAKAGGAFTIGSGAQLPNPREYVSAGIVFTLLGALAVASPPLAAWLGAGTVLGIASNRASKAKQPATGGSLAGTLNLGPIAPLVVTSPGSDGTAPLFSAPAPLVAPAPGTAGPNRFQ